MLETIKQDPCMCSPTRGSFAGDDQTRPCMCSALPAFCKPGLSSWDHTKSFLLLTHCLLTLQPRAGSSAHGTSDLTLQPSPLVPVSGPSRMTCPISPGPQLSFHFPYSGSFLTWSSQIPWSSHPLKTLFTSTHQMMLLPFPPKE